jgi:hypothetical protein
MNARPWLVPAAVVTVTAITPAGRAGEIAVTILSSVMDVGITAMFPKFT